MRARTTAGLWVTMVVAAAVALATSAVAPPSTEARGDDQVSAGGASAVHAGPQAALRARAHRAGLVKLVAAPPATPLTLLASARRLEPSPEGVLVSALSAPPPASRGPPASSIPDR